MRCDASDVTEIDRGTESEKRQRKDKGTALSLSLSQSEFGFVSANWDRENVILPFFF
jgi:hypothetical protein